MRVDLQEARGCRDSGTALEVIAQETRADHEEMQYLSFGKLIDGTVG